MNHFYRLLIFLFLFISPQAVFGSEKVFFYHTDAAGTPAAITDSSGGVIWRADYKPFGEEFYVTGASENNKRFVGKEKDTETGLNYFGARYMKTEIGRFISPDPVGAVDPNTSSTNFALLKNPQLLNPYAYGQNNPYRFIDADGNIPLDTIWDLGNMLYDICKGDWKSLALDTGAFFIPYVPAGVTKVSKIINNSDKAIEVLKILKPAGKLIGKEGSSSRIRVVKGGIEDAEELFKKLSKNGKVINDPKYPGTLVELPGGGRVGLRPVSKSGPPTIDIHNVSDIKKVEIKFIE